jgi:hypothetical protein
MTLNLLYNFISSRDLSILLIILRHNLFKIIYIIIYNILQYSGIIDSCTNLHT